MPAHNARPFIGESVRSVLSQTFTDFELVILENGSTDGTRAACQELAGRDPRIRVFTRDERLGNGAASNATVAHTRCGLLARMDADDLAAPEWLERVVETLERNPDAVLVGTLFEGIDPAGRSVRPQDRSLLLQRGFEAPFAHGGTIVRREAFDAVGGYRENIDGWEDLDYFQRLEAHGRLLVLPEPLYLVRYQGRSMTAGRALDTMAHVSADRYRTESERYPHASPAPAERGPLEELYIQAAMRLWRGQRPALLRDLAEQGLLGEALRRRPQLLGWGALGAVSPALLRSLVRALIARRDERAGRTLSGRGAVEWRFG